MTAQLPRPLCARPSAPLALLLALGLLVAGCAVDPAPPSPERTENCVFRLTSSRTEPETMRQVIGFCLELYPLETAAERKEAP